MGKTNKKINAAIIIIGNEILSGRTQDVNVAYLSKWLNELGIIVEEVRKKFNYVFTTGGIGPTHDDITAKSVAKAFKLSYGYHKEAYNILEKYYEIGKFTEGRRKMAKMPQEASLIYNPSSGAPGFIVNNVFCLPGIPSILQSMVRGLKNKIVGGKKILSKTISVRSIESEIAKSLDGVQKQFKNTEVGSYPFFRFGKIGVSIVMRSTKINEINACSKKIIKFLKIKKIKIIERE